VASTNPHEPASEYAGNAETKTLTITATPPRLETQVCPFCDAPTTGYQGGAKGLAVEEAGFNQIWLEGEGNLIITDKDGKRTGFVDGQFVSEIPGVQFDVLRSDDLWKDSQEPTYYVPVGMEFNVTVDGSQLQEASVSSVTMIGPGYDLAVDNINLDPGQQDMIDFGPDGKTISYTSEFTESPDILLGLETPGADYAFFVKGADTEEGATVTLKLDDANGVLTIDTEKNTQAGTYALGVARIDENGEQVFGHDGLVLEPADIIHVEYGKWQGDGTELPIGIDKGGDGSVDETEEVTDTP
jgi:hypothetical protein